MFLIEADCEYDVMQAGAARESGGESESIDHIIS
jgi:hypothetical protein